MNPPRKVALLGATGFIGRGLPSRPDAHPREFTGISRNHRASVPGIGSWMRPEEMNLAGFDAVVNLAGERIDRRWTPANRQLFRKSRVDVTRHIVESMRVIPADQRPRVLISASGTGFYGDRGDEILTESCAAGSDFLAELCRDWEAAALEAEGLGVRVVILRVAMVLGKDGDAFRKLTRIFRLGIGGPLGNGRQWMPWIHVDDLRDCILRCIGDTALSGPVNACAPGTLRNREFTKVLASALHRPALLPVPALALRIAIGGFSAAVLASCRAHPDKLSSAGFRFRFPSLDQALADLLG
jgi:uncharacterized protein (TIGR01777 family)